MRKLIQIPIVLLATGFLLFSGAGCTAKAKRARHLARADKYFAAGDYSKAEVEYLNVARLDPQNAHVIGRLGTIYYDEGLPMRAFPFLAKAAEMTPTDVGLHLKLGTVYLSFGAAKEAHDQALAVLNISATNTEAPALLAESITNKTQIEEVRRQLETISAAVGDSAAFQVAFGTLSARAGDLKSSEAAFRRAVSLDPQSSAAHFGLGSICWAQNNLKEADSELMTASDLAPVRSVRRIKYADFKIAAGEIEQGKRLLGEITKKAPDYVPAWMRQAEFALAEKKYDDCSSLLNHVLTRDSAHYEALLLKSQMLVIKGEPTKAITELDRLASIQPYARFPQVHYQLALAHLANTNDVAKALKSLNQALTLNPNFDDAVLLQARINIARGDLISAITALNGVLQRQPRLPQAHLALAAAYSAKGDLETALATYQRLGEMFPKNPETPFQMGLLYLQQNRMKQAREAFTKTVELAPDYLPAVEKLVDLDLMDEQYTSALARAQLELEKKPKAAEPQLVLAKVHLGVAGALVNAALKKEKEEKLPASEPNIVAARLPEAQTNLDLAEADLLRAIQLNPNLHQPYLLLARLYLDTKRQEKALDKLAAALVKDPQDTRALMLVATIQETGKDFPAARISYEKLLQINPSFYPALNNLAYLYSEKFNELDKAYEMARKARELLTYKGQPGDEGTQNPNRANLEFLKAFSTDTLGWIVFKRADYAYALSLLQESARTLSAEPEVQFHLGMAYYMLGQEQPARAAFERALSFNKDFTGKSEIDSRLALLSLDPAAADSHTAATLEQQLRDQPGDPILLARLARIYERLGDPDKAIKAYETALKQNRKNIPALIKLARLYSDHLHDGPRALELAQEAYKLAPDDPEISVALGRLAFQAGDQKWALSLLQRGAASQGQDPEVLYDLALANFSVGRIADAETAMKSALQAGGAFARKNAAERFLELAALALNPARIQSTEARTQEILKSNPDDVPALFVGALWFEQRGDTQSARQDYEKVIKRFPDFTPAQKRLAVLYAAAGEDTPAFAMATKARAALPDDPEIARTLGIIYYRRADYRNSVRLLDECVRKGGADGELMYYLGMNHYQALKEKKDQTKEKRDQLREQSKSALQQALALNIATKFAEDARRVLAELN